ncbi:MAG: hypothetical protein K8S99_03825 [Planctomycetes bacterium]|nr:hypothetical protein [Planctomycetota bacterium]
MIARIEGILESINGSLVTVRPPGGLTYEVLVSAYTGARLGGSIGQTVTLHTLHYLESQNQGASFQPRLAGFLTRNDREFFELFTSVKGIGNRRALRCMTLASEQIAAAIADRDLALLQSLPEIGRRFAETVVATLHGKVDRFAAPAPAGSANNTSPATPSALSPSSRSLSRDALDVLVQLGENRAQSLAWIDQTLRESPDDPPADVQALIARVYRLRQR